MISEWQKYLEMATGLTQATRQRAESVVRGLVKQGEVASDRAERVVDDLVQRSERNRRAVLSLVQSETERAVEAFGLVRRREFDRLAAKVAELEAQVAGEAAEQRAATTPAAERAAKTASARKAAKQATKKASVKKASAKKASARKSARKATGKRTGRKSAPPTAEGTEG